MSEVGVSPSSPLQIYPPTPLPGSIEIKELALDIKAVRRPFRFASGSRRRAPALLTPAKRLDLAPDIKQINCFQRPRTIEYGTDDENDLAHSSVASLKYRKTRGPFGRPFSSNEIEVLKIKFLT